MDTISIPNDQILELIANDQPFEMCWIADSSTVVPLQTATGLQVMIAKDGDETPEPDGAVRHWLFYREDT